MAVLPDHIVTPREILESLIKEGKTMNGSYAGQGQAAKEVSRDNVAVVAAVNEKLACDLENTLINIRSALCGATPTATGDKVGSAPEGLAGSQRVLNGRLRMCLELANQVLAELIPR